MAIFLGPGNDTFPGQGRNNAGNDTVFGGNGNDTIRGDGGRDSLFGGADNDTLFGGAENDELRGDGGRDSLFGGDGADRLFGGDDNDRLVGGRGADDLRGGLGQDRFVFDTRQAIEGDQIFDFMDNDLLVFDRSGTGLNRVQAGPGGDTVGVDTNPENGEIALAEPVTSGGLITFVADPMGGGNQAIRFEVDPEFGGDFLMRDFVFVA